MKSQKGFPHWTQYPGERPGFFLAYNGPNNSWSFSRKLRRPGESLGPWENPDLNPKVNE